MNNEQLKDLERVSEQFEGEPQLDSEFKKTLIEVTEPKVELRGRAVKRKFSDEMSSLESVAIPKKDMPMSDEDAFMAFVNEKLSNITVEELDAMTLEEINEFLGKDFVQSIKENMDMPQEKEGVFKRDFVKYLKAQVDSMSILDTFKQEMADAKNEFNEEMNKLFKDLNQLQAIDELTTKLNSIEDPEERKKLTFNIKCLSDSIYLSNVNAKIDNKSAKCLIKECNKEYDRVKSKALRNMRTETKMYMSPAGLENKVLKLVGDENAAGVKPLMYVIYRMLNKHSDISMETTLFINYFMINVDKCLRMEDSEDENMKKFMSNLISTAKRFI